MRFAYNYSLTQATPAAILQATEQAASQAPEKLQRLLGNDRLPYAVLLPKLHKPTIKFRVLTACNGVQLSRVGTWLTAIFRALQPATHTLWQKEVNRGHLSGVGADAPFYLTKSSDVIKMLSRFNARQIPATEFWAAGGIQGFDWTEMYPRLPAADLRGRFITEGMRPCWHTNDRTGPAGAAYTDPVVKVHKCKSVKAIWYRDLEFAIEKNQRSGLDGLDEEGDPTGAIITGRDRDGEFIIVTLAQAEALYLFLLDHAYIKVYADVLRQLRGIPMGISPEVYIANFMAFVYELAFLRRLVDVILASNPDPAFDNLGPCFLEDPAQYAPYRGNAARYIWKCFSFTGRFVDDLEYIFNPLAKKLMHRDQTLANGSFCGCYPRETPIEPQQHTDPARFPFLDTLQLPRTHPTTLCVSIQSHLYDKRRERCYKDIHVVQYTPPSADLSNSCLYNIFVGQLYRFQGIITEVHNYQEEVALLLHKLVSVGYKFDILHRKLKAHLSRHPTVSSNMPRSDLVSQIVSLYRQRHAGHQ